MAKLTQEDLRRMMPEKRNAYFARKKKVERNRKILGMFISVTVVLVTLLVLSLTVFFKINTITVKGDSIYGEDRIIAASGIKTGKNLFLSNVERASEGICRILPYISKANVKRKLPSTIIIEITGDKAYLALNTGNGTALADKDGKVLEFVASEKVTGKMVKVDTGVTLSAEIGSYLFDTNNTKETPEKVKAKVELLKSILKAIESSKLKDITAVNIKSDSNIYMMYQNRLKLNLGSISEIEYKLKAAAEIIAKEDEVAPNEKGEIFLADTDNIYISPEKN